MIVMIVFMILRHAQPGVPIHRFRNRLAHRHVLDVRIPPVPAARIVHVGCDSGYILDDTGFLPGFKLEIIPFRVPLVTHLRHHAILLGRTHHDFNLMERPRHRLLYIHVDAMRHSLNRNREMGMVRHAYRYRVNLARHLVEHRTEVLIAGNFREHMDNLLRMFCTHIHIAKSHHVTKPRVVQLFGNLATAVPNTDECDIYTVVSTYKRILRPGTCLSRNPKRRNGRNGRKRQCLLQERTARHL